MERLTQKSTAYKMPGAEAPGQKERFGLCTNEGRLIMGLILDVTRLLMLFLRKLVPIA